LLFLSVLLVLSSSGAEVQDSLRRAVLSQVRELKELTLALEAERAKSAALELKVGLLESELALLKETTKKSLKQQVSSPEQPKAFQEIASAKANSPRAAEPKQRPALSVRGLKKFNSEAVHAAPHAEAHMREEQAKEEEEGDKRVEERKVQIVSSNVVGLNFASAVLILRFRKKQICLVVVCF
jgi:hypothetical protein